MQQTEKKRNATRQRQTYSGHSRAHEKSNEKKNHTHAHIAPQHIAETNLTSAKKRAYTKWKKKISTTQKYIIRVQGHILYFTMCRNTAHGRHIICVFVEVQCVSSHFFLIYGNSYGSVSVGFSTRLTFISPDCYIAYALAFKFNSVVVVGAAVAAVVFGVFLSENRTRPRTVAYLARSRFISFSILCLNAMHKSASFGSAAAHIPTERMREKETVVWTVCACAITHSQMIILYICNFATCINLCQLCPWAMELPSAV